jgi:hypothetical protein
VPTDKHVMAKNRSKGQKEGFLSSDEEIYSEEEDEPIPKNLNDMSHVEVIGRK